MPLIENAQRLKSCYIIGGTPPDFPWGYDEESPKCIHLKTALLKAIGNAAINHDVFYTDGSMGAGIWAAEMVSELKKAIRGYS